LTAQVRIRHHSGCLNRFQATMVGGKLFEKSLYWNPKTVDHRVWDKYNRADTTAMPAHEGRLGIRRQIDQSLKHCNAIFFLPDYVLVFANLVTRVECSFRCTIPAYERVL